MTRSALSYLRARKIDFDYIDVEKDPAASEWVRAQNNGSEKKPTLDVGGKILSEPTDDELDRALAQLS